MEEFKNKIEEYIALSSEMWDNIVEQSEVLHIKKNETIANYCEVCQSAFFVLSGSFKISINLVDGTVKTVWFFLDEVFRMALCYDSYFLGEPTKYEIKALENSTVIKFDAKIVELWTKKYPQLYEFIAKDALNDFVSSTEIRNHMISHKPMDFIEYLKEKYPAILLRIPSHHIAHFMGITPEWYSKLKRKILLS